MNDPVHIMGFSLPRTEVFSLVVVGLVLGAGLVAIARSLAEERRRAGAKHRTRDHHAAKPRW